MGTNYYHVPDPCPTCGHGDERHIGKSSAGWCFSLHVYPEDGIHDLPDWEDRWKSGRIRDEYGREVSVDEMRAVVMARAWPNKRTWSREDMERNEAQEGPAGLVRSRIGRGCIKHGAGTWDCIVGEFS